VKGWEYLHRNTPDDLIQAVSSFKEAIELDPMYSRAHAALAWTYIRSSLRFEWQIINRVPQELSLMARKHLEIAMRNPTSTAHLVASKMALQRRQYQYSITQAQLALAFEANDPDANLNMASVLIATGEPEEGLEFVNKTMQLDPRNIAGPLFEAGKAYFIMGDLQKAALMTERAIKHNPTFFGRYEQLAAIYGLLDRKQEAEAAYEKSLKAWRLPYIVPDVTNIMVLVPIKDRQVADRYADGLAKAGYLGKPSDYHKILEDKRLTGEEIRRLVSGHEITVYEYRKTKWVDHKENGRLNYAGGGGNWWIEGDMLCYRMEKGRGKGLNDCGEIYRNPDALTGSKSQYLHVKDYIIAALTTKE
jgi:tetratricopeptide (TPR) repeat protein